MIPHSRMHNDRFSCRVTSKHNNQLDWLSRKHANAGFVEEVSRAERDTVLQVMTVPARLEAVTASLTTATKERVVSEHVEALGKEPRVTERIAFPTNSPLPVLAASQEYEA